MECGPDEAEKTSADNCHEFDLPVLSNVEKILVDHLALDLTSDIVSQSFEGTATYFIRPFSYVKDKSLDCSDCECLCHSQIWNKTECSPGCECKCHAQVCGRTEGDSGCECLHHIELAERTESSLDGRASSTLTKTRNEMHEEVRTPQNSLMTPVTEIEQNISLSDSTDFNVTLPDSERSEVTTSKHADLFEFVLDSSNIEIISAEEVYLTESVNTPSHQGKHSPLSEHKYYKTCSLLVTVERWCVKIRKEGVLHAKDFPRCIKLHYKTKPCGASLKWCLDQDGKSCVFTHGHWINNRSLFPAQDSPIAMATWEASIHVPDCHFVLMSGDETANSFLESNGYVCYKYSTTMRMPASTLALAVGQWNHVTLCEPVLPQGQSLCHQHPPDTCTVHYSLSPVLPCRLFAPDSLLQKAVSEVGGYIACCMKAAHKLLGNHPFYRLDILVVPKCFASLALACPSMMMISQTLLPGDQSVCIRLAHELSHSWFGLLIGPLDWTEEWLTEGFATYLEDCIHGEAMQWDCGYKRDYFELRAVLRHRNLSAEMMNTDEELQVLRPGTDIDQSAEGTTVYIKHGMNPNKTFTQVHYLKGYFLLRYLSELIGFDELAAFLKKIVERFHGQLITSKDVLEYLFETFTSLREQDMDVWRLYVDWLDTPGMPQALKQLQVSPENKLINEVNEQFSQLKSLLVPEKHRYKGTKRKRKNSEIPLTIQLIPDQLVLLLELMLEAEHCPASVLTALTDRYNLCTANADVRHRWCELIIKFRCNKFYKHVKEFLINDQAMGVYLFGELIISEDRQQRQLAELCFKEISGNMEEGPYKVVSEMLYGTTLKL